MKNTPARRGPIAATAAIGALALTLAACSGDTADEVSPEEVADVLETGGDLLVWAWDPTLTDVADAFMAEHPNVTVQVANVGTGDDHYTALQNAVAAGSGVPDLAQVEYFAVSQFTITESLTDLTPFGADELADLHTPGPWGAVSQGDGVWGLPLDSGPMAMFYNAAIFDEHGIEVPETWDDYIQAGRDLQDADPGVYIGADTGDAGFTTSMIWQAGGNPFVVDGTDVTVDLGDAGSQQFAEMWQTLIDEDLLADIPGWTDEWFQGMDTGVIATLVTGAWMPGNLESGAPNTAGDWRVAPMPQYTAGEYAVAESGGSSLAMMDGGDNDQALAYAFLEYASVGDGVGVRIDGGAFPTTVADLESEEFQSYQSEYFGGQEINVVLAEAAANVVEGWQYLPFQAWANSVYSDTVGRAYIGSSTLTEGLAAWQDSIVSYGTEQGFGMSE